MNVWKKPQQQQIQFTVKYLNICYCFGFLLTSSYSCLCIPNRNRKEKINNKCINFVRRSVRKQLNNKNLYKEENSNKKITKAQRFVGRMMRN